MTSNDSADPGTPRPDLAPSRGALAAKVLAATLAGLLSACGALDAVQTPSANAPAARPAVAPPEHRADGWVEVVLNGVDVRAAPAADAPLVGELARGMFGIIAGAPVEADGETWYPIADPGMSVFATCSPPAGSPYLACEQWFGWVAVGTDESRSIRAVGRPCTDPPTTIDGLGSLSPGERITCFGDGTFTFEAYVPPSSPAECVASYRVTPEWLGPCAGLYLEGAVAEAPAITARLFVNIDPILGECEFGGQAPDRCPFASMLGQWVTVDAHHNDVDAATCAAASDPSEPTGPEPDPLQVVYECRLRLVVTDVLPATTAQPPPSPATEPAVATADPEAYLLEGFRTDPAGGAPIDLASCVPRREGLPGNATHGIECSIADGPAEQIGAYLFPSGADARHVYEERLAQYGVERDVAGDADGCGNEAAMHPVAPGEEHLAARYGTFLNESGFANLRVIFPEQAVYIGILGRTSDCRALDAWAHSPREVGVTPNLVNA